MARIRDAGHSPGPGHSPEAQGFLWEEAPKLSSLPYWTQSVQLLWPLTPTFRFPSTGNFLPSSLATYSLPPTSPPCQPLSVLYLDFHGNQEGSQTKGGVGRTPTFAAALPRGKGMVFLMLSLHQGQVSRFRVHTHTHTHPGEPPRSTHTLMTTPPYQGWPSLNSHSLHCTTTLTESRLSPCPHWHLLPSNCRP